MSAVFAVQDRRDQLVPVHPGDLEGVIALALLVQGDQGGAVQAAEVVGS